MLMKERTMPKMCITVLCELVGRIIPETFSIERITIDVDGSEIPLCFPAQRSRIVVKGSKIFMEVKTGYGFLEDDFTLDDAYDYVLEESGLSREDLTARFLSDASRIIDINVESDVVVVQATITSIEDMERERDYPIVISKWSR